MWQISGHLLGPKILVFEGTKCYSFAYVLPVSSAS